MIQRNESTRKVTITDIATIANVSKSTVSRVINGTTPVAQEKREAVLAAMKAMDFEPNIFAQGLAGGTSKTIGVVTQSIGCPFYDAISQGVVQKLSRSTYSAIFADGQWDADAGGAAVDTLLGRRVAGLILVGNVLPRQELERIDSSLPVIVVGQEIDGWEDNCLFVDNEQAGYDATKHLIDLGHRTIAHVTGLKDHQDSIRRQAGYRRALEDAGITIDEDLIVQGQFDGNSGVMAIEMLLSRNKTFSAMFCANDITAFGACLALSRRGFRVPDDVSIVGFDDQAEAAFSIPPLTTVRQPAQEMGDAAATAMLKRIDGTACKFSTLPVQIVARESTRRRV